MSGRDLSVGWCRVICDNGETYFLPRQEYGRLSALVPHTTGWHEAEDVFGAMRMFRLNDVSGLWDCTPDSLKLEMLAESEHDE